jgi:hypothetical protein
MGDFGIASEQRNADVARALEQFIVAAATPPERVFELGDNFYYYGLVGQVESCPAGPATPAAIETQALSVLEPFEFLRDRGITLTAIPGNHDHRCADLGLTNQVDIDRWLPPAHQWGERWQLLAGLPREVVLAGGAVQLITLDSERMITDCAFRKQSAAMLERLLVQGRGWYRWRMIAAHHPLRTNGVHDAAGWKALLLKVGSFVVFPSHLLAALRVPPFAELNEESYSIRYGQYRRAVEGAVRRSGVPVSLFLAGHDHQLQLLAPRAAGEPFVLISGAAAKCDLVRAAGDTIFAAPKNGFAAVTVEPETLVVEFIGTSPCDVPVTCAPASGAGPHRLFRYRIPLPEDPRSASVRRTAPLLVASECQVPQ